MLSTVAVERLGIPKVRVTDGPSGARGNSFPGPGGPPSLSETEYRPGETITVTVPVTNTGRRSGSEIVQCYVAPESPRLARPPKELKAFAKVWLRRGETTTLEFVLEARAFA